MAQRRSSLTIIWVITLAFVTPVLTSSLASAAIVYPDFGPIPPGISFTNIFESSVTDPLPLYGPPTGFAVGLDFSPANFGTFSAGGGGDITDGQLNFTLVAAANNLGYTSIDNINLFEAGDFSLTGTGTAGTIASAGAILRASVTQVNGVDIAPVSLTTANAAVNFNLLANPGMVQPWSLGTSINVSAQMMSLFGPNQHATKIDVVINNQMVSISEPLSVSFVAKKEFVISVGANSVIVPEPAAASLAMIALAAFSSTVRRKRQRV